MLKDRVDIGLIRRPQLAPHLRFNYVAGAGADSGSGAMWQIVITSGYDREYCVVFPLSDAIKSLMQMMDGKRTIKEIFASVEQQHNMATAELQQSYLRLINANLVISADYAMAGNRAIYWLNKGTTPACVERQFQQQPVELCNLTENEDYLRICQETFDNIGLNCRLVSAFDDAQQTDTVLRVYLVNDYLQAELESVNQQHLQSRQPWMPLNLSGCVHQAGPVYNATNDDGIANADVAFCWRCTATLMGNNRQIENAERIQTGIIHRPATAIQQDAIRNSAYLISLQLSEYLLNSSSHSSGRQRLTHSLWVYDQVRIDTSWHCANALPQCSDCGTNDSGDNRQPTAVILDDVESGDRYPSSGWRAVSPEQTFARYQHLYSPYTGVTDRLDRLSTDSDACQVYEAGNNIAVKSDSIFLALASVRMRNAGKGISNITAKTGALCEAIERYSITYQGDEIKRRARFCDFGPGDARMPNHFQLFSQQQLDAKNNAVFAGNPFINIPDVLSEEQYCDWVPVWSVTENKHIWVPAQLLYFGYSYKNEWIAVPDTNGVAAGNTKTDAFVQAFLEVLERDAVSIWWYNCLSCPGIDIDTVDHSLCRRVVEAQHRQSRCCSILDISFDLDVNIFVFISYNTQSDNQTAKSDEICFAIGAHFDPEIALVRAICEHDQLWSMINSRRKNSSFSDLSPDFAYWLMNGKMDDARFNYLHPDPKKIKSWQHYQAAIQDCRHMTLPIQRQKCFSIVEKNRWQLCLADFTRIEIGMPVIRVLIPQLRTMHRRLDSGRLYEVPVKLGYLNQEKTEQELNPVNIFV